MTRKILCFTMILLLASAVPALAQDCDLTGYRLFVDPGHGGADPGAIGPTGLRESDVTLGVGLLLRDWLEYMGATVRMSRTTDATVALTTRATLANNFGAHRFVSVHMNSFSNPAVDGTETFVVPNASARTRHLGQSVLNELVYYLGTFNRGLKTANFTVLTRTVMPATLSESVFISNPYQEAALYDFWYQWWIATAQAQGFCDHLAVYPTGAAGDAGPDSGPPPVFPPREAPTAEPLDLGQLLRLRTQRLIDGDGFYLSPRFSPDGRFLAFGARADDGLYVLDTWTAGSTPQRLASDAGAGGPYAWSPDGRRLAYSASGRAGFSVKWADLLSGETGTAAAPSPDPLVPAFAANGDLLLVDAARQTVRRRARVSDRPSSRPGPPQVIAREGGLWIAPEGRRLPTPDADLAYMDAQPSPDGSYVLAQASHPRGAFLFAVDAQTGAAHHLSLLGVGRQGAYNLSYEGAWSPDGRHLLVNVVRDDGDTVIGSDLYLTDREGKSWQRLAGGGVRLHPTWSAQNRIAFDDGAGRIVVADLAQ